MTEKEKILIQSWLVSEDLRLDEELQQLQARIRYRKIDVVDCIELALLIERYQNFKQFSDTVDKLLHLF